MAFPPSKLTQAVAKKKKAGPGKSPFPPKGAAPAPRPMPPPQMGAPGPVGPPQGNPLAAMLAKRQGGF